MTLASTLRDYDYGESPILRLHHNREVHVTQTLAKSWWLLALCGVLEAIYSAMNFVMEGRDGSLAMRTVMHRSTGLHLGELAVAAGVCTIAAGIWSFRNGKSWLLVLNGVAFSALGLIFLFWRGPLAFRTVALLIVVMALSLGINALLAAGKSRRHAADEWLIRAAGVVSVGFALAFLAFVFGWIKLDPGLPAQSLHWMGSYFGFSAICMLWLALRLRSLDDSRAGRWQDLPALGHPKHAL